MSEKITEDMTSNARKSEAASALNRARADLRFNNMPAAAASASVALAILAYDRHERELG